MSLAHHQHLPLVCPVSALEAIVYALLILQHSYCLQQPSVMVSSTHQPGVAVKVFYRCDYSPPPWGRPDQALAPHPGTSSMGRVHEPKQQARPLIGSNIFPYAVGLTHTQSIFHLCKVSGFTLQRPGARGLQAALTNASWVSQQGTNEITRHFGKILVRPPRRRYAFLRLGCSSSSKSSLSSCLASFRPK